jgi:hypothetical protein
MRYLLFLLLLTSSTVRADNQEEYLPFTMASGNQWILVLHNQTYVEVSVILNGSYNYVVDVGETAELMIPNGYSAVIYTPSGSWYAHEYLGDHVNTAKPFVRHIWVANGPSSTYEIFRGPESTSPIPTLNFGVGSASVPSSLLPWQPSVGFGERSPSHSLIYGNSIPHWYPWSGQVIDGGQAAGR